MGAFIWIALILFAAWILGFVVFHVAGFAIHLLIIAAVIALAAWIVSSVAGRSRRTV